MQNRPARPQNNHSTSFLVYTLHLATLFAFAVAQPLYELLGNNPEFFPVRNNGALDIILLTVSLSLLIPFSLAGFYFFINRFSTKLSLSLFILTNSLLFLLILLPPARFLLEFYPLFSITLLLTLFIGFLFIYARSSTAKLFITYLSPSILVFPLLFLFNTPVSHLLRPTQIAEIQPYQINKPANIVFIVLDELPVSTLLNSDGKIDQELFPGLAEFSNHSTWYRNASTIAEYTVKSVPAMLTGKLPSSSAQTKTPGENLRAHLQLPTFNDYPDNIFTALSGQYDLNVFETVTSLCPDTLCQHPEKIEYTLEQRLPDLINDLFIIYQHTLLPKKYTRHLPRIDMNWSQFSIKLKKTPGIKFDNDIHVFDLFMDSINTSNRPALYFHHMTLPHSPWTFLPSGRQYSSPEYNYDLPTNQTWPDTIFPLSSYQRHILQTSYADRLLSSVFDRLKSSGLYDSSLIIITSDHGASFTPGSHFRQADNSYFSNIVDVPLFIKSPYQDQPYIEDRHVLTTDILPIIFNTLQTPLPWPMDPASTISSLSETPQRLPVFDEKGKLRHIIYDTAQKQRYLEEKSSIVGRDGLSGVFGGPVYAHLIGTTPIPHCSRRLPATSLMESDEQFSDVSLSAGLLPVAIKIHAAMPLLAENESLAVTLNNHYASIIEQKFLQAADKSNYLMLDERQLVEGKNVIDFYAIKPGCK